MITAQDQQSRAVIAAWNAQADEHNQWETLGDDEKIDWAMQAARALPARGVDPMLDTPAGMEPVARVCLGATANIEWRKGMTYADLPAIDGQDLYTAAQVQAMLLRGGVQSAPDSAATCMDAGDQVVLAVGPPPPAAQKRYRLLQRGIDTIQADDEFLRDADSRWQIDPCGIFVGMPYMSNVLLPARRAIEPTP